jgi:hypothetical protein
VRVNWAMAVRGMKKTAASRREKEKIVVIFMMTPF